MSKRAKNSEKTAKAKPAPKTQEKPVPKTRAKTRPVISTESTGFSINSTVVAKGAPTTSSLQKMVDRAVKKVATAPITKPNDPAEAKAKSKKTEADEIVNNDDNEMDEQMDEQMDVEIVNRKRLLEQVAERCGKRPNQVRAVMDAVLAELGDSLVAGKKVKHPELGTLSVQRRKSMDDGEVIVCKLRTHHDQLAEAAE